MLHLIIGHRGVGKTSFLKRLRGYYEARGLQILIHDLDHEVALRAGLPISEIFSRFGEDHFRNLERETLAALVKQFADFEGFHFVALGAGFQGEMPFMAKVIWLRRRTDRLGRILVDRPRLNAELSPLDEYQSRYLARTARYRKLHHKQIFIEEGWDFENVIEPHLLGLAPADIGMSITVLPEVAADEFRLEDFITEKTLLGIRYFELRNDLLTSEQMDRLFQEVSHDRLLFSFRTKDSAKNAKDAWWFKCQFDWALELGECPWGVPKILSLHYRDRHEGLRETIDRMMEHKAEHYKLAVLVENFVELWAGHSWWQEDPANRSFLPLSTEGRWWWYRAIVGTKMKINFISEGEGSSFDQPTLFQQFMVNGVKGHEQFAAVLGRPLTHSRTPAEQHEFFKSQGLPVVAIEMSDAECNELSLSILHRLGLRAAAVTAPLKDKMAGLCEVMTRTAADLRSVNTIVWSTKENCWSGENTDIKALESIFTSMALPQKVFVWGGGGVRSTLMRLLPKAQFFRARTGEEVLGDQVTETPDMLVWCVGRHRQAHCSWPNASWKPKMVFDLNYTEDSPGREYAQLIGAKYFSGLEMFKLQAKFQREFWTQQSAQSKTPEANP